MKKLVLSLAAAALSGATLVAAPVSAQSASFSINFGQQQQFVDRQCRSHPGWHGCNDFHRNHRHWSRNDYRNWYLSNRPSLGGLGLGLFAFALGAAAASNNNDNDHGQWRGGESWEAHVRACEDHYRSYNPNTDMFLSYHNGYQRCTL
jgi:hypothetical protein